MQYTISSANVGRNPENTLYIITRMRPQALFVTRSSSNTTARLVHWPLQCIPRPRFDLMRGAERLRLLQLSSSCIKQHWRHTWQWPTSPQVGRIEMDEQWCKMNREYALNMQRTLLNLDPFDWFGRCDGTLERASILQMVVSLLSAPCLTLVVSFEMYDALANYSKIHYYPWAVYCEGPGIFNFHVTTRWSLSRRLHL